MAKQHGNETVFNPGPFLEHKHDEQHGKGRRGTTVVTWRPGSYHVQRGGRVVERGGSTDPRRERRERGRRS